MFALRWVLLYSTLSQLTGSESSTRSEGVLPLQSALVQLANARSRLALAAS